VRYQVPPLSRPLPLKIEVVDPEGTRTVLEREVKGGESIAVNVPYVREAAVTVYLGGEFVWQDRYRP
jgi:serine/threonine-protein kinase